MRYILAIDQSTSGTKAILFDEAAAEAGRADLPHEQKISPEGWVSHDPMEIYRNTIEVVRTALRDSGIDKSLIAGVGISNQRETALVWERESGRPVADAVVWQCTRAAEICARLEANGTEIRQKTGLPLSPYFSAAKIAWLLEHCEHTGALCAGTIDSWLVYKLCDGVFKTDCSNASRTQLLNLHTLQWDTEICRLFGIDPAILPEVCDSNALYGYTDFEGLLDSPIPVHGVLGDSHASLFGHGCHQKGLGKVSYGTGSSVMVHTGDTPVFSENGVATSLAWRMDGHAEYVLEGNVHYSCAVIRWLVHDVGLLKESKEAGIIAAGANPNDTAYLVPAFTGLGAPWYEDNAKAVLCGMTRGTGAAEIVKAAEECIAYQITDVLGLMRDSGAALTDLRADGGGSRDAWLMRFQAGMLGIPLGVSDYGELSAMGAACAAGIALGIYDKSVFESKARTRYLPEMDSEQRGKKYRGWQRAVEMVLGHARAR